MPIKTSALDEMPSLNLTAMIDILFLLIIFFMLGTKFVEEERRLQIDVPRVGGQHGPPAAADKRVLSIDRAGAVTLDGQRVSLAELTTRLAAARRQNPRVSVLVRGDAGVSFQLVASALGACKEAGVSDLGVSVKTLNAARTSAVHDASHPR